MKLVEIDAGHYGSTGRIMLHIAELVRKNGGEAHTFSGVRKVTPPLDHEYFGNTAENMLHRAYSVFTASAERTPPLERVSSCGGWMKSSRMRSICIISLVGISTCQCWLDISRRTILKRCGRCTIAGASHPAVPFLQ